MTDKAQTERDEALNQLSSMTHAVHTLEKRGAEIMAERDRYKGALSAAQERLNASLFTNAEHSQAKDIISAALEEKEND